MYIIYIYDNNNIDVYIDIPCLLLSPSALPTVAPSIRDHERNGLIPQVEDPTVPR